MKNRYLLISLIIANILDFIFTATLVNAGGVDAEANPFVKQAIIWFGLWGIALVKTPPILVLVYFIDQVKPWMMWLVNFVYWPVVIYSTFLVLSL